MIVFQTDAPSGLYIFKSNAWTKLNSAPDGTTAGDMLYWNGTAWVRVAAGLDGQTLTFKNGTPNWKWILPANTVYSSNNIWMDRNLGATQIATTSTDVAAYGDLYQWGRTTDGHQIRTSATTNTLSNTDAPGNGSFILPSNSPYDWRDAQNDNLWQGVNGINNPCPFGFRIPTSAEWNAERLSWNANNSAGGFNSPLKLTVGGIRLNNYGGFSQVGHYGSYWTSTINQIYAVSLYLADFSSNYASLYNSEYRSLGMSVRCIKD